MEAETTGTPGDLRHMTRWNGSKTMVHPSGNLHWAVDPRLENLRAAQRRLPVQFTSACCGSCWTTLHLSILSINVCTAHKRVHVRARGTAGLAEN